MKIIRNLAAGNITLRINMNNSLHADSMCFVRVEVYYNDFLLEIPVYRYCEKVIEITSVAVSLNDNISGNLMNAYEALHKKGIVEKKELKFLNAWLKDVDHLI